MQKVLSFRLGLGVVLVSVALGGCAKQEPSVQRAQEPLAVSLVESNEPVKAGDRVVVGTAEQADVYVRIGERLLSGGGYTTAHMMFSRALELDASSRAARFYLAFTGPLSALRGAATRFNGLFALPTRNGIAKLQVYADRRNLVELKDWIYGDPRTPALSNEELSAFVSTEIAPALAAAQTHLSQLIGGAPIEIMPPTEVVPCNVTRSRVECASMPAYRKVKVDEFDLQSLRASFVGYGDALKLASSVKLTGLERVVQRINMFIATYGKAPNPRQTVGLIKQYADLGALRAGSNNESIRSTLPLALEGLLLLKDFERSLCRDASRLGSEVLLTSICVANELALMAVQGIDALAGRTSILLGKNNQGQPVEIAMELGRFLTNFPADLKALLPTDEQFDANGNPTGLADMTLGGLFPDGDLFDKIKLLSGRDRKRLGQRLDPRKLGKSKLVSPQLRGIPVPGKASE